MSWLPVQEADIAVTSRGRATSSVDFTVRLVGCYQSGLIPGSPIDRSKISVPANAPTWETLKRYFNNPADFMAFTAAGMVVIGRAEKIAEDLPSAQ